MSKATLICHPSELHYLQLRSFLGKLGLKSCSALSFIYRVETSVFCSPKHAYVVTNFTGMQ